MAKRKTTDPDPTGPDADTPAAGFDLSAAAPSAGPAPAWPPTAVPFACTVETVRGRRLFWVECIETSPAGHFTGHINDGIARGWRRAANVPPGSCHPVETVQELPLLLLVE